MQPKTKYRSISHWFSYNWGWVLGGVLLLLFLLYTNVLRPSDPKADYIIGWVGASSLSDAELEAISQAVARAGADQNGDGQITTSVRQYLVDFTMSPDHFRYQENYANAMKLIAQIQAKECLLYLLEDPELFQYSTGVLCYLDGSIPEEADNYDCANWRQMCVPWPLEGLGHEVYLGRRSLFSGEDSQTLFPGADILFDALTDGC